MFFFFFNVKMKNPGKAGEGLTFFYICNNLSNTRSYAVSQTLLEIKYDFKWLKDDMLLINKFNILIADKPLQFKRNDTLLDMLL